MKCTCCGNPKVFLKAPVKVMSLSKWEFPEGSRKVTRQYGDSAVRWHVALCADCALQSARQGFEDIKSGAVQYILLAPLILIALVIMAVVGVLGLFPAFALLGGVFLSLMVLLGVAINARDAISAARKLRRLERGAFDWSRTDHHVALETEARRIIKEQEALEETERDTAYPLPHLAEVPVGGHDPRATRLDTTWRVTAEQADGLTSPARNILSKHRTREQLTYQDLQGLVRDAFPVCEVNRTPQETDLIEALIAFTRQRSVDRRQRTTEPEYKTTELAIQLLGRSRAKEAVPCLIDILGTENGHFQLRSRAGKSLETITDHVLDRTDRDLPQHWNWSEDEFDKIYVDDAADWRAWWAEHNPQVETITGTEE